MKSSAAYFVAYGDIFMIGVFVKIVMFLLLGFAGVPLVAVPLALSAFTSKAT